MNNKALRKQALIDSTIAGIVALGLSATPSVAVAEKKEMEKCYGIVKAGKNDCASPENGHHCHAGAKKDRDPYEWIKVPKGTCEKIAGGSLTPGGKEKKE